MMKEREYHGVHIYVKLDADDRRSFSGSSRCLVSMSRTSFLSSSVSVYGLSHVNVITE